MSPKVETPQKRSRKRRKNPTVVPVFLASAALFASMAGFLGVQVAQGNDPLLGAKAAALAPAKGSPSNAPGASQSTAPKPTPIQTSTSGSTSPTASTSGSAAPVNVTGPAQSISVGSN
ncbi:MAG: hypothetical protein WCK97_05570 [Actinomycetes bacterium]